MEAFREGLPIRRTKESRQGLAHARNRAVAGVPRRRSSVHRRRCPVSTPGWLTAYRDAIRRFPDADYFGGRILPDWGQMKPRWVRDEPLPLIDGVLGLVRSWCSRPDCLKAAEPPPFGASFAIRRRLFDKIGTFRVDLGTGGAGLGRGEETEFLMRARVAGAQGVYVGEALCFHAYDPARLTPAALYRYGIACGKSHNAIADRPHHGGYGRAAWFVVKGSGSNVKRARRSFSAMHHKCRH